MSTLTMALAVTFLAGSAADGVSGKTRESLDLGGTWVGTYEDDQFAYAVRMERGQVRPVEELGLLAGSWASLCGMPLDLAETTPR